MQSKVVVITGGFGGLGQGVAKVARAAGATTVLIDYAPAPSGGDGIALGGVDLTKPEAAEAAMKAACEHAGRIDALLNIAGGFHMDLRGGRRDRSMGQDVRDQCESFVVSMWISAFSAPRRGYRRR
jgi:NAD(P)-dependent dehydrogenase (short-subunit alcohol dehydrogenase family)